MLQRRMRVATWNVQTGRPNPDGPPAIEVAAQHLAELDADVVAVQELDRGGRRSGGVDQPSVLARALDAQLLWAPTVQRSGGEYGVALLVRGGVASWRVVDLGGTREPRALVVARVEVAGERWTVGGTHLSRDGTRAAAQLRQVLAELDEDRVGPGVLLGDWNLTPRRAGPVVAAAGWSLVEGPPTHSTRQRRLARRIDHVAHRGVDLLHAAVHRFSISDHCAVVADLTTSVDRRAR